MKIHIFIVFDIIKQGRIRYGPMAHTEVFRCLILDTRISVRPLCAMFRGPPLDSETRWTRELWSKTNLLNWQNSENSIFFKDIGFFKIVTFLKNFLIFFIDVIDVFFNDFL